MTKTEILNQLNDRVKMSIRNLRQSSGKTEDIIAAHREYQELSSKRHTAAFEFDESRPPPKEGIGERPGETPSSIVFEPGRITFGYATPEKPRHAAAEPEGKTKASPVSEKANQAQESDSDRIAKSMVKAWGLPHRPTELAMDNHLRRIGFDVDRWAGSELFMEVATDAINRARFEPYAKRVCKDMHDSARVRKMVERQAKIDAAQTQRRIEVNRKRIASLTPEQRDAELESHLKGGSDPKQVVMPSGIIVRDYSPRK